MDGGGKDWNAVGVSGRFRPEPIFAGVSGSLKSPAWEGSSSACRDAPGAFRGTEGISGVAGGRGTDDVREG